MSVLRASGMDRGGPATPSSAACGPRRRTASTLPWLFAAGLVIAGCTPSPGGSAAMAQEARSVSGAFLAGQFALARGDIAAAAFGLDRALAATPDDLDLRRQVFLLMAASGEVERTRELARDVVEADDAAGAAEARLWRAADALRTGTGDARVELEAIDERSLPGVVRPLIEAWLAADPAAGAATLGETEARLGELTTFHRVALLDRAGRPEEALGLLAGFDDEPSALPERMLAEQARLLARVGEAEAAGALLRLRGDGPTRSDRLAHAAAALAAGQIPPPAFATPEQGIADGMVALAELLAAQRRPLQATFYARTALHAAPDYDPAWLLLGGLLAEQEGAEAALAVLDNIPEGSPWHAPARLERAEALGRGGEVEAAVAELRRQIEARPHDARPAMALGDLLRREQRFAEATDAYAKAIQRIGTVDTEHWRLFYARGIAYERSQRWPEAERDLQRALELSPDQPYVLNYLGYSWVDQGLHLAEAKAMLYRAVELQPDDGYIVDSLGWAYYRLGEYDEAVRYLEQAIELAPGDPVINDHLGDAFWRVGRYREARFQWERALTLDPEPEDVPAIEAKLERGLGDAG